MKIDKVEIRHIKMKLVSPFKSANGIENYEEHIIIKVESENLIGWGECVAQSNPSYTYETVETAWHILSEFIIPKILNKDFYSLNEILSTWQWIRGHNMAKAGIEAALWDLFAKIENVSLSKLFGGNKNKIEVGVSIGLQNSNDELLKKISGYLDEGYKRIKIKIKPGKDVELVSAIRKEFPKILLQVDANSSYQLSDINILKKLDEFNLLMIEQPLAHDDIYQHSKLQKQIQTPICLDESITSINDTIAAIELGSCKIINIKPGRVGGFTEAKKIHDYCSEKNIPVWHGGMLESGIGRAGNIALASLPNFNLPADISASKRYFEEDIIELPFEISKDGTIKVPNKPGIGVNVNSDILEKVTVKRKTFN